MEIETKNCQNCKNEFTIESEDFRMYEKFDIPPSDLCPRCRWKYLLAFWAFGKFRVTKSALSGKQIITVLPESVSFPIYEREEFVSDAWDPLAYGKEYTPEQSFFEQFIALQSKVPHPHNIGFGNTNCPWTDDWSYSKDCYLSRSGRYCEKASYSYRVLNLKDTIDATYCFDLEKSYDCLYCFKGFKLHYSFNCHNCIESAFLYDCRNCSNCFLSWNLRNKQYYILNQPYSKEEYFKKLKEFDLNSYSGVQKLKQEFNRILQEEAVHRANLNIKTVNSQGNFLTECKNCYNCYFVDKSENMRHSIRVYEAKDSIDSVSCISESSAVGAVDQEGYGNIGILYSTKCRYSAYLDNCEESEYCFGSVGLRKKKYCILNNQYNEEKYKELVAQIKKDMKGRGEWGRFFPLTAAYSGYNLSLGQILFPEIKANIIAMGGKWDEEVEQHYENTIQSSDLPDSIKDVSDSITSQRIICPETGLSYNIASHELEFYREHGIPLPRQHFDWRTKNRYKPMTLMLAPQRGTCIFCKKEHEHYYAPELGYKKVACVECYQQEIA